MTSSVAGFLDFSIYLGAGLSGIITGFLSNRIGWNIVILLWIIVGIAGCICIRINHLKGYTKLVMMFLHIMIILINNVC